MVIKGDDEGIACTNCHRAHEGNMSSYRVRVFGVGITKVLPNNPMSYSLNSLKRVI